MNIKTKDTVYTLLGGLILLSVFFLTPLLMLALGVSAYSLLACLAYCIAASTLGNSLLNKARGLKNAYL